MSRMTRFATTAAATAAAALAGVGLAGTAAAQGPNTSTVYQWCPGQGLPFPEIRWDMNVCHNWFIVPFGQGNVSMVYPNGEVADSFISADVPPPILTPAPPPPPPPPGTPFCSPRGALIIIPPICDEIGIDNPPGSVRR